MVQPQLVVSYYKQNRHYTCGPACLRMVLKYFGIDQDEVSLTMLCRTTLAGTGLVEVVEAAQHFGFHGEWKIGAQIAALTTALKRGIPIIAVVDARVLHRVEMSKKRNNPKALETVMDYLAVYIGEKAVAGTPHFDAIRKVWSIPALCVTPRGFFWRQNRA